MAPDMAGWGDAPRVGAGSELERTRDGDIVAPVEELSDRNGEGLARARPAGVGEGLERRNSFAVGEQLAARAATPSTRRQYAAIDRPWGLAAQRAPPGARGWRPGWRRDRRRRALPRDSGRARRAAGRAGHARIYLSTIRARARRRASAA